MDTEKNKGNGSGLKYQARFIDEEWFDVNYKGWIDFLRLNFFDHEHIADALEKNTGKVKTSKTRQFRTIR